MKPFTPSIMAMEDHLVLGNPTGGVSLGRSDVVIRIQDDEVLPIDVGLVGHWTFDEGEGTTAGDLSGYGNHGTLQTGATWAEGKIGNALQLATLYNCIASFNTAQNGPNYSGCTSLTSVTIPDSVTSIGESAFSGCRSVGKTALCASSQCIPRRGISSRFVHP